MAEDAASATTTTTSPQTTTIHDLFGDDPNNNDDGDVFAQLNATGQDQDQDQDQDPFEQIANDAHEHPEPTQEEEKLFANATQSAEPIPPQQDNHPSPPPPDELPAPPSDEIPALPQPEETVVHPTVDEQDFSDLLAEFEAEKEIDPQVPLSTGSEIGVDAPTESSVGQDGESVEQGPEGSQQQISSPSGTLEVPIAASALFTDDPTDSFADLIPQDPANGEQPSSSGQIDTSSKPASPSPVPSLSIEHSQADVRPTGLGIDAAGDTSFQSMFSDASNWLGDTTFDDSIQMPNEDDILNSGGQTQQVKKEDDGHEPLDFEIPQGWYDEGGEWHWYTDEEKEQVRQTMLGQGGWGEEAGGSTDSQAPAQNQTPLAPYSPALQAGVSENAARRTPQPETPSKMPSNSYDPYAPSTAQASATSTAYPMTGTSQYASSSSAYVPYSGVSSTAPYSSTSSYAPYNAPAPPQSSYDAYTPATQRQQQHDPYAPAANTASNPYAPSPVAQPPISHQASSAAPKSAPTKPPVQRMTSNAYDPPFLKPQKSFVRAASATSSPSFNMPHSVAMSPPQASSTPPPPPPGPPKRTKTEGRLPSREPGFALPPKPIERAHTAAVTQHDHMSAYDAPPRPPSVSHSQRSVDQHEVLSPRKPLHRPPPSAFDPPLSQPSYRAPSRTASAASHHNYESSPQPASHPPKFAPPPKASESPYGPPRPLSRGPPSRQSSPMFAARPPSRPDVTQRMRSPPSTAQSLGEEQLLSPPKVHGEISDHHGHSSLDERRVSAEFNGAQRHYGGYVPHPTQFTQSPPSQPGRHLSPPVLSRRFDEDGEDGDVVESLYSPVEEASRPIHHDQQQYQPFAPPQSQHSAARGGIFPPTGRTMSEDPYAPSSSLGLQTQHSSERSQPSDSPYAPYAPTQQSPEKRSQPATSPYAPYEPTQAGVIDLNEESYNPSSQNGDYSHNPYAPSAPGTSPTKSHGYNHTSQPSRASTTYEPSIYSPPTATKPLGIPQASNPYAPAPARTASPAYSAGFGISPPANNYFQPMHAPSQSTDDTYIPQQVLEQKPVSEDPLGRTTLAARNAPIAVFGFGGTLVTAFPGAAESGNFHKGHSRVPSYGYASGRGQLWIRSISEVAAPAALKSDLSSFPGPLVFDPLTPKGAAGDKKKREAVLGYLDARAEEIERGLPYLKSSANKARREEEGKLVLIKALKALVIGEGKLAGTPEVEEALREALANPSSPSISTSPVATISAGNFGSSLYPPASSSSSATPVAASVSQLTRISSLLAQGNKRDAALYAADQGLWSHALIISSNVDVDLWREIVTRFTVSEVGERPQGTAGIKASYLLSGGVNPTIVDELVKAATITNDPSNDQWREVIGSVLFNAKPTELACLDEMGSKFLSMGLINAAHACFLLSPLSPFFDLTPAAYERPITLTHNVRDEEAIVFAEIAEYARSLVPTPKGQEAHFAALPQLLPYKLARAWRLAELGEAELAQKYCTAIEAGSRINKNLPSLLSPAYAASLEDLLERLTGEPSIDPPNVLGSGRKAAKPGFDKLGSWIEGRLTKFIAGEEGDGSAPKPTASSGKVAGPFSQFSTISTGTSGAPSRNTSVADLSNNGGNGYLGVSSVSRTTSPAMQMTPQWGQQPTVPTYGGSSSSSSYGGDTYNQHDGAGGYSPWTGDNDDQGGTETPHAYGDDSEFINPMAQLNLGPSAPTSSSYEPPKNKSSYGIRDEDEDEDDLGFGNSALSRDRTPKPPSGDDDDKAGKGKAPVKDSKPEPPKKNDAPPAKPEHKSSWLGRIWGGKKEGEQSGPVKANLGEESSMIFDPELKRWVVKGAKPEPAGPSAPPPPPRAQTASPSRSARPDAEANNRAMSATPPPGHRPPPSGPPMGAGGGPPPGRGMGMSFAEGPDGSIKRMKSSLNESVTASDLPSGPPSGPPKPPSIGGGGSVPPSRTSSGGPPSIDDLLSRPPSKRPASAAAKKGARNRYVDVFQQPEGQ
ncbi:hypothetical protein I302_105776 [Kwoniella bestiolae CBS 10118]|uniref:Protein transport protein sec16 n=1 Tax=Kwoniella bestiolae CBS 10118 TaxID=1296100 RepID=A0A1B9G266_9TREE|nr:hypothetical protein I302_04898 [Kwoniella bestiolae CBS 10118]OCF25088.1 hypothetical protein I302_04898 [Kwoniella bestiolae CBS 10118]